MYVVSVFVRVRPGPLRKYRALPRKHTHNHADDVLSTTNGQNKKECVYVSEG